jgi:hypothetical protein
MNIHTYQEKIKDLVMEGERLGAKKKKKPTYYPGCYIISRTMGYNLFKLGEAHGLGGLYQRIIGQYKICMSLNSEFFLRYLVITHREKQGRRFFSQIMEKELLKTIDSKVEDSYSQEYIFTPDISELEERMSIVLNTHQWYYTMAIKFTKNGFRIYDEEKGFKTKLMNFNELPNLNPAAASLITLASGLPKEDDY